MILSLLPAVLSVLGRGRYLFVGGAAYREAMKLFRLWTVSIAAAITAYFAIPALVAAWIDSLDTASPILFMSAFAQAIQFHEASIMLLATWMVPAVLAFFVLAETSRRTARLITA